jgi:ubiquinone/menaquinone biosynthesis C-methylase UbiE
LETEKVRCNLCGADDFGILHSLGEEGNIVKCQKCGLVYRNPRPTQREIDKWYEQDFHLTEYKTLYGVEYTQDKESISKIAQQRMEVMNSLTKPGRILDVGCAAGFFLDVARRQRWEPFGVEVSPYIAKFAKEEMKLDVFVGELHRGNFQDNFFTATTIWYVLEHTQNPFAILKEMARVTKIDGIVAVSCPNIGGTYYRFCTSEWLKEQPSLHHFYDFSAKTLSQMMEKVGLRVEKVTYGGKIFSNGKFTLRSKREWLPWGNTMALYARKV